MWAEIIDETKLVMCSFSKLGDGYTGLIILFSFVYVLIRKLFSSSLCPDSSSSFLQSLEMMCSHHIHWTHFNLCLSHPLRGTWTTPSLLPAFLSFVICYDAFCGSPPCSLPPDLSASSVGSHFLSNTPPSPQKLNSPVNAAVSQEIHIQTSSFFIATHSSYVSWSILSCNYLSTRKPLPLSSVQNSGYKCLLP